MMLRYCIKGIYDWKYWGEKVMGGEWGKIR